MCPPPEIVLVQTPPALPTLLVVRVAAWLIKAKVVIDWHNLGYTILALRLGERSRLVRLAEGLERWSGRKAYAHLFVTEAMKNYLSLQWGLEGEKRVLHDRPPGHFRRAETGESHKLFGKLIPSLQPSLGEWLGKYNLPGSTPFTEEKEGGGEVRWREGRPALVVSSTSWTADEDFGLLLRAARIYEFRARALADGEAPSQAHSRSSTGENLSSTLSPTSPSSPSPFEDGEAVRTSKDRRRPSFGALRSPTLPHTPASSLPKLLIIVTGKGELRARYLREIAHLETSESWRFVRIRTAWLETPDYPILLGSADIGVSLHTSSSGLDLPMKVVDMLGCGLPVCALDFACLDELVREKVNGVIFRDAEGLAKQWESLFAKHPERNWLAEGVGMKEPFAVEGGGGVGKGGVPMSPNPSMTLLHSPSLENGPGRKREGRGTWGGNWKYVMRPLLYAQSAEGEGEGEEESSSSHSSALRLSPNPVAGLLQRRAKGYARAPTSNHRDEDAEEADEGQDRARKGFTFVSQPAKSANGESQKGLRQRKSVSTKAHDEDPFTDDSGRGAVPQISVSPSTSS